MQCPKIIHTQTLNQKACEAEHWPPRAAEFVNGMAAGFGTTDHNWWDPRTRELICNFRPTHLVFSIYLWQNTSMSAQTFS